MNRRKFIAFTLTAGAGICGGCLFGCTIQAAASNCGATTPDILGPYFRPNAPTRSDLTFQGVQGTRLSVFGTVYSSDCSTPLPGAKLDVWHCGADGQYDNTTAAYLYRGAFSADKSGAYDLRTILPGRYLNGDSYRPAHIHFLVSAPGFERLVTQLYFVGDPYLESDPFSSKFEARSRILPVSEQADGSKKVQFNIVLGTKL